LRARKENSPGKTQNGTERSALHWNLPLMAFACSLSLRRLTEIRDRCTC
jgi:hypothetical protein